jgi:hypothetical protein
MLAKLLRSYIDKLKLTGQNSRYRSACVCHAINLITKTAQLAINLITKTAQLKVETSAKASTNFS